MFSALADPTRRDIVARLTDGDATVNELADALLAALPDEPQQATNQTGANR